MASEGLEREAWRQSRRQISEHEQNALELQFDLDREKQAFESATNRLNQVTDDITAKQERMRGLEGQKTEHMQRLMQLHKASSGASQDTLQLTQQLDLARKEVAKLEVQLEQDANLFETHIKEQEQVLAEHQARHQATQLQQH